MEHTITHVDKVRDIYIQMDDMDNFNPQRLAPIAKIRKEARWVLDGTLRTLWRSLIHYHREYCSHLWIPVGNLGNIQAHIPLRAFTKRVKVLYNVPY